MSFDRQRLEELVEYFGRPKAAELISNLIDGLKRNMADLHGAEDPALASRHGHRLKGLAGLYGLNDVAASAEAIEDGTCGAVWSDVLATLDGQIAAAIADLERAARNLSSPA